MRPPGVMMPKRESWLDVPEVWLARWKRRRIAHLFTWFTRALLFVGFVIPGTTKLLGQHFTVLPLDNPVGFFFEALYRSGAYYQFIGLAQVLAAVLLLVPRTATLGALMYFPIILNIFVLTVAMDFRGTPFITAPMLLASVYLLCWDYDKLRCVLD